MALILPVFYFITLSCSIIFFRSTNAQNIATDLPVPPLQWINLSGLLHGSSPPPPLKDAAIGYDESSRSIVIFGGESAGGFVQSQTYLLNLDTLTWSIPSPPQNLESTPPARSAMVAGGDFAASYRRGFVVIGGKGTNGNGLSDIWEYDFISQFWSEVGVKHPPAGPLPRWGASGGSDIFAPPIQDPTLSGPNNTFYIVGGTAGNQPSSLSDVWRLNISGTLSSNLPNDSAASWDKITVGQLPPKTGQAGTVVSQQLVTVGGCDSGMGGSSACAQQDSYVIDVESQSSISPKPCPAPRTGSVVVANANKFSTAFASQVYLLLGTLNTSRWQDDGGLNNGEVAILDIHTGSWSRVLPAGDPGSSGKVTFPTPREGAAALSYPMALVGQSRNASSDTVVFGGRDSSGNLLSEVWILRAYGGVITASDTKWSGFGDGRLQTGINADGSGVFVRYLSNCATPLSSSTPSPTTSGPARASPPSPGKFLFTTSSLHHILAPLSLALLQPVFLFLRHILPWESDNRPTSHTLAIPLLIAAYVLGIAGVIVSFTTLSTAGSPSHHSTAHLATGHGIAGIVFFGCLYGLAPGLFIVPLCLKGLHALCANLNIHPRKTGTVPGTAASEKSDVADVASDGAPQSVHNGSPRARTYSLRPSSILHEGRFSSDSESVTSTPPRATFEVVNRPPRPRRSSSTRQMPAGEATSHTLTSRSLAEIDWLQRRRTLNAVGELDYAISQAQRAQLSPTPATADALLNPPAMPPYVVLSLPSLPLVLFRIFIQVSLLGLSIVTLVALWTHAPRVAFAVFLTWTIAFYVAMFIFAWHLRPKHSILAIICSRVFHRHPEQPKAPESLSQAGQQASGPYVHHQPPYGTVFTPDDASVSHAGPRSIETETYDDDIDEDTRQRMIEEEMGRREVSIITIPKRQLWVVNP